MILFTAACSKVHYPYQYTEPAFLDDGWETMHMDSLNVDTPAFYQLFNQLNEGGHMVHSILLVKDKKLIVEEYFGKYSTYKQHDLRSVSKSIRSILMGIAIDKGFVDSLDDPFSKYVREPVPQKNLDPRKKEISIRHLLTMSPGLDCNDWDKNSRGQEDRIYRQKDWLQYFLNLPMVSDPGTVSNYCSVGTILAAEVISQASGMAFDDFADQYLFNPLGIENVSWGHTSNKEVSASAKRLYMTPRDMAKIGQLILNKGKWNGQQVVSEDWVEESTSRITKITGMDYGYLWWSVPLQVDGELFMLTAATGNGGQYIFVLPELQMVAIFTGGAYNSQDDKLPFAIMSKVFIQTFKDI
jgi:CubicO group peptidase (beta-lactamase class C family)